MKTSGFSQMLVIFYVIFYVTNLLLVLPILCVPRIFLY